MKNLKPKIEYNRSFYENVAPMKLTEGRRLKLNTECWGLLTHYYLESAKISSPKVGVISSSATLKVGDRSGQISCVIRGPHVGLLFGLTMEEWTEVEKMCDGRNQLFYRYFKNGLSNNFCLEQKLFYNFCLTNQKSDVLVAVFHRCVNVRNKDKKNAFLYITDLRKCDSHKLDLYLSHLRQNS